jgi:hypothetical protein
LFSAPGNLSVGLTDVPRRLDVKIRNSRSSEQAAKSSRVSTIHAANDRLSGHRRNCAAAVLLGRRIKETECFSGPPLSGIRSESGVKSRKLQQRQQNARALAREFAALGA